MERNYSNRDFEQLVKQNADQYRMFPSEKVWKGVHSALHTRRRWYGFGLAFLLLLTGGAVTLVMKSYPVARKQDLASFNASFPATPADQTASATASKDISDLLPFNPKTSSETETTAAPVGESDVYTRLAIEVPVTSFPESQVIGLNLAKPFIGPNTSRENQYSILNKAQVSTPENIEAERLPVFVQTTVAPDKAVVVVADEQPQQKKPEVYAPLLTIESITNQYKAPRKRLSWQVFVTPTISYRKLGENKEFAGTSSLIYPFASLSDVNNAVTHKPDFGLQLGFSARYPITKNLRLLGGFQLNVNRYDIKAFAYPGEVAVINLDGGNNSTVSTWTYYRSQSGYKSDWLKNFYLSVSVPIGAEVTLMRSKKKSFGIAGTVQPTYIVKDRAYLISTDYKNYAEIPWLVRRMNVSTGFEAFVNYTRGNTNWQIGPQVRYQLLSSYQKKYPVKENLFDFGVKIGLTLNQ